MDSASRSFDLQLALYQLFVLSVIAYNSCVFDINQAAALAFRAEQGKILQFGVLPDLIPRFASANRATQKLQICHKLYSLMEFSTSIISS